MTAWEEGSFDDKAILTLLSSEEDNTLNASETCMTRSIRRTQATKSPRGFGVSQRRKCFGDTVDSEITRDICELPEISHITMGKVSTLVLLLFCTLHVHSFNLRSDTDSSSVDPSGTELTGPGDNTKGGPSGPAEVASDPAQHLHDAANKWLTPAEQLVMKDKAQVGNLAKKYDDMQKRQNELREAINKRLKESANPANMAKKVQSMVAEVSGQEFMKFKDDINAMVDRVYELLKPKLEETCTNMGYTKFDSATGAAVGGVSPTGGSPGPSGPSASGPTDE